MAGIYLQVTGPLGMKQDMMRHGMRGQNLLVSDDVKEVEAEKIGISGVEIKSVGRGKVGVSEGTRVKWKIVRQKVMR